MKKMLICLIGLFVLMGCGKEKEVNTSTLIVAQGADPKTLDPEVYNDVPSLAVAKQIYSTLVTTNEKNELIPSLAESWEQLTETEWVFYLRKGVKFHNGEEMTAEDVKFSLERMLTMPSSKMMIEAVNKVNIIDKYTIKVFMNNSFSPFLFNLTHPLCSILNKEYTLKLGKDFGQNPMGTGPFKFVNWSKGDFITLAGFKDYFEGAPSIEKVIFRSIPENTNRVIGLETGEIDIAYGIAPVDMTTVENDEDLKLIVTPSLSTEYVGINVEKEPFTDKRVREAIGYAINKKDIVDVTLYGKGIVADTFVSPNVYGSNQDIHNYNFNPEKAKKLLKEAGIAQGTKINIWVNENPLRTQSAQIIQANLKEIGIDARIEILEWGTYIQKTGNGEHQLMIIGWNAGTGDADNALYPLFHSASKGGAGNRSFYANKKVDDLIEASRIKTGEERKNLLMDAQTVIMEDAPVIPLFYKNNIVGINKTIKNFVVKGSGHHILKDIKKIKTLN